MKTSTVLSLFTRLFVLVSALALGAVTVRAQTVLLKEDWSTYADGAQPKGPWTVKLARGASVAVQPPLVTSSFKGSGKSVSLISTEPAGRRPSLLAQLIKPAKDGLQVSFDFFLSGANMNHPTFFIENLAGKEGLYLTLFNNGMGTSGKSYIVNNLGSGKVDAIAPVRTGIWYRVLVTLPSAAAGTYDVTVTPDGGTPVTVKGLALRERLTEFAAIEFGNNSKVGTGNYSIANVNVSTP
jgi:hypothetical protein